VDRHSEEDREATRRGVNLPPALLQPADYRCCFFFRGAENGPHLFLNLLNKRHNGNTCPFWHVFRYQLTKHLVMNWEQVVEELLLENFHSFIHPYSAGILIVSQVTKTGRLQVEQQKRFCSDTPQPTETQT
jgi:hypothetical protein